MSKDIDPKNLSPKELHLLVQHLKLGHHHLEKQLGQKEFNQFLQWGELNEKQEEKLKAGLFERLSQLLPALNSIVTSIFGAFIGLSLLLGFDEGNLPLFCFVCCLVVLAGGVMGYLRERVTQKQAQGAILHLTTHKAELRLWQILNEKLEKELLATIHDLTEISEQFAILVGSGLSMCEFKKEKDIQGWLKQVSALIDPVASNLPNEHIFKLYQTEIERHLNFMCDVLPAKKKQAAGSSSGPKSSFIQILTNPASLSPHTTPLPRSSLSNILLNVVPAMLGGFASLFVFANGFPGVAKKLGILRSENVFTHPYAQLIELILMVSSTLYFGASALYASRKKTLREKEIAAFDQKIIAQETEYLAKTNSLHLLGPLKTHLSELLQILCLLQNLDKKKKAGDLLSKLNFSVQ